MQGIICFCSNKIAYVVNDCVENWPLEEKGQCNKNLGHLFLLVFYIEDQAKLRRKLENAINDFWDGKKNEVEKAVVVENNNDNPRDIDMTKLPGIDKFADFCLISLLKMYVGIHRDMEVSFCCRFFCKHEGLNANRFIHSDRPIF